jgi:chromosome partitioning protein
MQCEFFAMEGLAQLVRTVNDVRDRLNPTLAIQGVVLTMHDRRNRLTLEVEENVRSALGDKVYTTLIPRNVRVAEAPSFGKPVLLYDHRCEGAKAYIELASEVIRREQQLAA